VPYRESYTAPCEQNVTAFCDSLQKIFSSGALLRGAGGVALVVGVTLGAFAILHLTHRRWSVAGFATVAFLTGIGGLWLSQQALEAYYQLSLFPHSYPPQYFQARLAMIASESQVYTAWSIGAMERARTVSAAARASFSGTEYNRVGPRTQNNALCSTGRAVSSMCPVCVPMLRMRSL
jgi:hypothetical protein